MNIYPYLASWRGSKYFEIYLLVLKLKDHKGVIEQFILNLVKLIELYHDV